MIGKHSGAAHNASYLQLTYWQGINCKCNLPPTTSMTRPTNNHAKNNLKLSKCLLEKS